MAEILAIESNKVKIGTDDGKIIVVPVASLTYAAPKVGDEVKVYQGKNEYSVSKVESSNSDFITSSDGTKKINKHLFVWVFSFLLGGFGVDRFLRGQIGAGVCKLLFGWITLGIWGLVDWIIALTKAYGSGNNSEFVTFDQNGSYVE